MFTSLTTPVRPTRRPRHDDETTRLDVAAARVTDAVRETRTRAPLGAAHRLGASR